MSAYNGEIYNFRELVQELQALGYQFRTRCDTEVILYAWQDWGEACVQRFRGMFAFALYDRTASAFFWRGIALGVNPCFLACCRWPHSIFGSELKVLKAHPQLPRQLEPQAVEDYFALGYMPEPKTIYRDVFKLRPGHTLLLRHGEPVPAQHEYWDIPFAPVAVGEEADLRGTVCAPARGGGNPAGGGSAPGGLPVRWGRLQRRGGADGPIAERPRQYLRHWL